MLLHVPMQFDLLVELRLLLGVEVQTPFFLILYPIHQLWRKHQSKINLHASTENNSAILRLAARTGKAIRIADPDKYDGNRDTFESWKTKLLLKLTETEAFLGEL